MKVAIAGYGAEGQSSYRYFCDKGDDVTIVTNRLSPAYPLPEGAQSIVADDAFDRLGDFDLIVRTPPMRPDSIVTEGKVWSQANEFFANCPAPIIGVTGTKGKGTTCSLIASILREAGQKVHLVGNIGVPALDVLTQIKPSDVVVFELSSFQLWDLEKSPQVAVVLMIEPDHLDVHRTFDEYVDAKANIVRWQTPNDVTLFHPTNHYSAKIAQQSGGASSRYAIKDDGEVYIDTNTFFVHDTPICSIDSLQIPGAHNSENACAAISASLRVLEDISFVEGGLRNFSGLPHRLKFIRHVNEVAYYDDSIATTPGSAIAALKAFGEGSVIILGGSDKGADYSGIVDECRRTNAQVIAIGQTGEKIQQLCEERGVFVQRETGGMKEVVKTAYGLAKPGGQVILSPASASFDQYKSYSDRGDQFIAAVGEL